MVPLPGGPPGIPHASLNQPIPLFANVLLLLDSGFLRLPVFYLASISYASGR